MTTSPASSYSWVLSRLSDGHSRSRMSRVVVLSYRFWQRRFGGDLSIIGKTLTLNGEPQTVVGVAPAGPSMLEEDVVLWIPTDFSWANRTDMGRWIRVLGRLKHGTTVAQAQAELDTIAARLEKVDPSFNTGWRVNVVPLREELVGNIRLSLLVLLGAVGFLLLIACANVANLFLVRGAGRRKEIAVRVALGAGRGRLNQELLTETTLLAGLGGVAGLGLAVLGIPLLLALVPIDVFLPRSETIGVDVTVLGFALVLSLLTGTVFGLVPALEGSRFDVNQALREGGRNVGGGARSRRFRAGLVVAEIALALLLLVGAGLLIRSLIGLQRVEPGLDPEGVFTARVVLPGGSRAYDEDPHRVAFFEELLERLRSLPGVVSASAIQWLPLSGQSSATDFKIEGLPEPPPGEWPVTAIRVISPDYFRTVRTPLLKGRTFTERDNADAPAVAVVNKTLADRFWPGDDPIGKRLAYSGDDLVSVEVIGVVGDVRHDGLDADHAPATFRPHAQMPARFMNLVVRTTANPATLAPVIRSEVQAIDRDQPIAEVRTLENIVARSIGQPRFNTLLLGQFAALALLLAAVGIYGVMSDFVVQRTNEIGIRMALGARAADVLTMVLRKGLALVILGLGIGLAGAFALTRLLESLLFGVTAADLATYVGVALLLSLVAVVAILLPALRATRVDPLTALHYE